MEITSTRMRILEAAQDEIYRHGYQGMRIEAVLQRTGLAKGALYHHFPSKLALGYAVIDEFLTARFESAWEQAFTKYTNPVDALMYLVELRQIELADEICFNGCPMGNLIHEMGALDEGFQTRLLKVQQSILSKITDSIQQGIERGVIRAQVDARKTALFFIAAYQGIISVSKCMQSPQEIPELLDVLRDYVSSLSPENKRLAH